MRCGGGGGVVEAVGRGGAAGTEVRCRGNGGVVEGGGRYATAVAEVRWWSGTCRQIQGRRFGYV